MQSSGLPAQHRAPKGLTGPVQYAILSPMDEAKKRRLKADIEEIRLDNAEEARERTEDQTEE